MTTVMICQMKQINTVKIRHTVTVTYTIHVLTVTVSYSHGNVMPSLIALTARMSLIVTVSEWYTFLLLRSGLTMYMSCFFVWGIPSLCEKTPPKEIPPLYYNSSHMKTTTSFTICFLTVLQVDIKRTHTHLNREKLLSSYFPASTNQHTVFYDWVMNSHRECDRVL